MSEKEKTSAKEAQSHEKNVAKQEETYVFYPKTGKTEKISK